MRTRVPTMGLRQWLALRLYILDAWLYVAADKLDPPVGGSDGHGGAR